MENNEISFFRYDNIEIIKGNSCHSFPKHSHKAFCIGAVTDGRMRIKVRAQEFILNKNDVYFIPPFTEHTISAINNSKYGYIVICIYGEVAEKYSHTLLHSYISDDQFIGLKLLDICQRNGINSYAGFEKDIQVFLIDNIKIEENIKRKSNEIVKASMKYISEHIDEPFDLQQLSEYIYISKYYLLRIFKNEVGVAPYQFYLQEKVKKIRQELLKEQAPAILAYDFGFTDQSHLCNTFKKHVGLTPNEFKKSYNVIEN